MDQSLDAFLDSYPPEIQALAQRVCSLILEILPGAIEQVDPPSKIVAYGYGRKYADLICAIAPFPGHINLMFSKGASLPDPQALLEGTGKRARHVKIRDAAQLSDQALRTLLETAKLSM